MRSERTADITFKITYAKLASQWIDLGQMARDRPPVQPWQAG